MTDQELDAAILRLRTIVLDRLARQSDHIANEDRTPELPSPGIDANPLAGIERENEVRWRWKSLVRWFRRE
jgi:hypothetical protein